MKIEIKNIGKSFGKFKALEDINLSIEEGELIALLGPSGCGKTTLLRIIAGLEIPDEGEVNLITPEELSSINNVGFVFQHYALFKHMNVFENVAFGLKVKPKKERETKQEIRDKVNSLLKLIQMDWAAKRFPNQLSGGQRQRVALARALAIEPKILLLDEPFGALDAKVRKELRRWLRNLHDQIKITSIFVTHDQEEALELANRVVVMNRGKIIQIGSPKEIYDNPVDSFVFDFIGNVNKFIKNSFPNYYNKLDDPEENKVVYVRPHDISIFKTKVDDDCLAGTLKEIFYLGAIVKLGVKLIDHDSVIEVEMSREAFDKMDLQKDSELFAKLTNVKIYDLFESAD